MNHLKTYKVFESRFDDFKEIIDNLYDYSLDFSDDGLPVQIMPDNEIGMKVRSLNISASDKFPFFLRIYCDYPNQKNFFKFQQYIPTILSIINYMKSEGYDTTIELDHNVYQTTITSDDFQPSRLSNIETVHKITLTFDKINKNYDI